VLLYNSNTRNPVTNLQNQPEDPTGFIYRTYSAGRREDYEEKPIKAGSNQAEAYVSFAIGGSLSQISFEVSKIKSRPASNLGGGIKGKVRGFSRVSRRNFLRKFACINRTAFRAYKGMVFSVTLTYPHEYPEDPEACKRHLKALYKRLKRRLGEFAGFWRLGIQTREAWHFHLLLVMPPSPGLLAHLRRFISSSWYEVCGGFRGPPPCRNPGRGGKDLEEGYQLRREVHGQRGTVPRRLGDGQDLGGMERGIPPRPVGDGEGRPQGRLQNQEVLPEAGEDEG
jgi:hypothetical protein